MLLPDTATRYRWPWLAGTVLLVLVLAGRIAGHAEGANGPWYWRWPWNEVDPLRAYPAMALGLVPFLAAQWMFERRGRWAAGLALLMASTLTFALANTAMREPDFSIARPVAGIVENYTVSGYLTDARRYDQESVSEAVREWLREWPERSPALSLHNRNKPPGATLYFAVMLHLLGDSTALVAGLLIGVLAPLAIPAGYGLLRATGLERDAAFHGASYLALCPGLIVFFPQLDPLYVSFAASLLALWVATVDRGTAALAAAFGLALSAFTLFTYNFLVLGAFIAAYWTWRVATGQLPLKLGLRQAAIALLTVVAAYALLWAATGYDPVRAFQVALANQAGLAQRLQRPYPATILYDLLDFMLGTAYVAGILALYAVLHLRQLGSPARRVLVLLCLGQVVLLAVLGLLPAETLRVWAFLLPLLMVPVGLALGRFAPAGRLVFYLSAWLVLAATCQNMNFTFYKKRKPRAAPPEAASLFFDPAATAAGLALR